MTHSLHEATHLLGNESKIDFVMSIDRIGRLLYDFTLIVAISNVIILAS